MNRRAPDLSVEFCGKRFINPFLLSSSPVSNSAEMVSRAFEAGWAGVAYKTVVTDRIPIIHPSPRMKSYDYEQQPLVGLQNVEQTSDRGLRANLLDMTWLKKRWPDRVLMASIMGFSNAEWGELARACTDAGADMLELNFSCPHMTVEGSGAKVGTVQELVRKYTETVRAVTSLPLVAKMTTPSRGGFGWASTSTQEPCRLCSTLSRSCAVASRADRFVQPWTAIAAIRKTRAGRVDEDMAGS